jgi:hypothetical protein
LSANVAYNITEHSQNRRMRVGVIIFAIALGLGVLMTQLGVPFAYRFLLIIPFWAAANAFTSALYKT